MRLRVNGLWTVEFGCDRFPAFDARPVDLRSQVISLCGPSAYPHAQKAFSFGARRNDVGEQMRYVAHAMTTEEIEAVSWFYADCP